MGSCRLFWTVKKSAAPNVPITCKYLIVLLTENALNWTGNYGDQTEKKYDYQLIMKTSML